MKNNLKGIFNQLVNLRIKSEEELKSAKEFTLIRFWWMESTISFQSFKIGELDKYASIRHCKAGTYVYPYAVYRITDGALQGYTILERKGTRIGVGTPNYRTDFILSKEQFQANWEKIAPWTECPVS